MMESGKHLRKKVYEIILKSWPIHISGICKELQIDQDLNNIARLRYHVNILREEKLVNTKKIDRALVSWPCDVEKIRFMHEFMKDVS